MSDRPAGPPTADDWGDPELCAFPPDRYYSMDLFFGKSIAEIMPLLERNFSMRCIDDLADFPEPVFAYYVDGFFAHLANGMPDDEDLGVELGVFLSVMERRRQASPDVWRAAWMRWPGLLDTFVARVRRGRINAETAQELMEDISVVSAALR
ncbi:hypothetical protein [Mitsuaria sp. 7]|uniref:hypothetical protein n=1 Tax=Mitsuaria sp. 7 TaxID=1658665 RepID=UPI0007DDA66A|nr:hypothetical protein [Mitsuaria sp. 7]ANH68221.1 hypothetical protein ABE85_12795 [Mitsuaria sp. 7]